MAKIALVADGMGGLGEAICLKLATSGYQVVTTYSPGNAKFEHYPCDVTQRGRQ